jgi:hypothetical protein
LRVFPSFGIRIFFAKRILHKPDVPILHLDLRPHLAKKHLQKVQEAVVTKEKPPDEHRNQIRSSSGQLFLFE